MADGKVAGRHGSERRSETVEKWRSELKLTWEMEFVVDENLIPLSGEVRERQEGV